MIANEQLMKLIDIYHINDIWSSFHFHVHVATHLIFSTDQLHIRLKLVGGEI